MQAADEDSDAKSTRHIRIALSDAEKMACVSFCTGVSAADLFREMVGKALDEKYAALPAGIRKLHKGRGRIRSGRTVKS